MKQNFSKKKKNNVPDHWALKETANEFDTTIHYARKARTSLETEGVFGQVELKQEKICVPILEKKIKLFFNSDDISRMIPGIKDTVSMKMNGVR